MSTIYESLGARSASFIRGTHRLLIGGRWVDAQSGKTFDVFDPARAKSSRTWLKATPPTSILPCAPRAAHSRPATGRR